MSYTIKTIPFLCLVGLLVAVIFASSRPAKPSARPEPGHRPFAPPNPNAARPGNFRQPSVTTGFRTKEEMDAEVAETAWRSLKRGFNHAKERASERKGLVIDAAPNA